MLPCHFVIFGAAGHLARTKLLPSLYDLEVAGRLDPGLGFTALARRDWDDAAWRSHLLELLQRDRSDSFDAQLASRFAERFGYLHGEHEDADLYRRLRAAIADRRRGACQNVAFYLAVPPGELRAILGGLHQAGLNELAGRHRIVIEKPFGEDLASARALNEALHSHYDERQIYRIDHYLGKETVQNLLVFRFANAVIEPLWNRRYIDHVQITLDESAGVGSRGGYFDKVGTLRDMVQSHLLQVLALVAMEPPATLQPDELHGEKSKVLRSIRPLQVDNLDKQVVRGQYTGGNAPNEGVPGYLDEDSVAPDSSTETFVAMKLHVDNWRWQGVPFYLRTGKRLAARQSMVAIRFRDVPHKLFRETLGEQIDPNWLVLSIQPDEAIRFELQAREPGLVLKPRKVSMDTRYRSDGERSLDAYATLLLDVTEGDRTLFIRFDEVETAWQILEPVLHRWRDGASPLHRYASGTWGPDTASSLFSEPGRTWRNVP
jgi:glucose-6-phosphate 1-dehydrogenase